MKTVVITDIEDLISAKLEIDKFLIDNGKQKSKMSLEEYMNKYAIIDKIYLDHGKNIPFNILKLNKDNIYLFFIDEINEKLINILKSINFNLSKLQEIFVEEIINKYNELDNTELIIIDNKYYKVS